jgi:Bacterial aa3 type cytochrome c oxidase subunit IV
LAQFCGLPLAYQVAGACPVAIVARETASLQKRFAMAKDYPHQHGKMDIREHQKTYEGFWAVSVYTTVAIIVLLVWLAWMFT